MQSNMTVFLKLQKNVENHFTVMLTDFREED